MPVQLLAETASQTAGPYVHIGLALAAAGNPSRSEEITHQLAKASAPGQHISLIGQVFDGNGHLVRDSFIELWQANAAGEYDPEFSVDKPFNSFGRCATTFDGDSSWCAQTVKPGVLCNAAGVPMAPYINLALFARGINIHLHTRVYFDDEAEANAQDPVLNLIEQPQRRQTLIAKRCEVDGKPAYRFDIHIQGEDETVFFDF
jgi:protocatechuate 3,4-dioxygenase alpha subunit